MVVGWDRLPAGITGLTVSVGSFMVGCAAAATGRARNVASKRTERAGVADLDMAISSAPRVRTDSACDGRG